MNQSRTSRKEFQLRKTHQLRFSNQSLQIRYAQSQLKQCTVYVPDEYDESQVIEKSSVLYDQKSKIKDSQGIRHTFQEGESRQDSGKKKVIRGSYNPEGQKMKNLKVDQCMEVKIHSKINDIINQQEELFLKQNMLQSISLPYASKIDQYPQYFVVNKVEPATQKTPVKTNEQMKYIYIKPMQIDLPKPKMQGIEQVQAIIPCTYQSFSNNSLLQIITPTKQPRIQQSREQDDKKQITFAQSRALGNQSVRSVEKNKIVTDILLEKIKELENKVKQLEQEKKRNAQTASEKGNYQSTPHFLSEKMNHVGKINQFSSKPQSQEGDIEIKNNMWRARSIFSKNTNSSEYKIHSNLYSISLSQPNSDGNIKQQIRLLKQKLAALENTHIFNDPSIKDSITQNNQKIFNFTVTDSKLQSPNRKQLEGKIVKRKGFGTSMENSFKSNQSHTEQNEAEKEFVRSRPQNFIFEESKVEEGSKELKNRENSSAIFRKNRGPAIEQKNKQQAHGQALNTLQFNPERQKYILNESKEQQSILFNRNNLLSPIYPKNYPQINIPELMLIPTSENSSDQLVEIGKIAFKKLGCDVSQNTVLNVKRYKNCVHFSINAHQNILWHYEGRFYFGSWKSYGNGQGEKSGKGIQYCPGKYKYKGLFKQGKRQGYGQIIYDNGSAYMGYWKQGQKHGKGKAIEADGLIYEGQFKMGKKSGHGKIINQGKLQFEGEFEAGYKNGFGKQYFQNGDYYEGQYLNNKFEGQGKYVWQNKAVYNGEFKQGKRHGHGVWRSGDKNYDTFEGQYAEDNKNGYGIYTWTNGAVYKGPFKDDLKHGQGTITYENGSTVSFTWKNGHVVEKSMTSSQDFDLLNRRKSHSITSHKNKPIARSSKGLQSAKVISNSNSADKLVPKGVNFKKDNPSQAKLQFRTRVNANSNDILKGKISGLENTNKQLINKDMFIGIPKDPPYKTMQTTSNINMNL